MSESVSSSSRSNGSSGSTSSSSGSSSSSNSTSSESQTATESLQSEPTTGESLADSPTTADSLSRGTDDDKSGTEKDNTQKTNDKQTEAAIDTITSNLDQSGLFNDVTHSELLNVNNTLAQLTPDQTNRAVTGLSDQQLSTWTDEIDSNGILGTGGLNDQEQTSLFDNLASDLNMNQLGRVSGAFQNTDTRQEFTEAISRNKSTDEVRTVIGDHLSALPANAANVNLQNLDTDLAQYQNAQTMAKYSKDSYNDFAAAAGPNALEPGTTRLNPDQLPQELNMVGEQLVDNKSGFHAAIYKQGQGADASYVVAFRGTENATDWKTNAASGAGFETKQFTMANDLVEHMVQQVGSENVVVTGHSLGGGLANYAAMKNEVHSTAFNSKGTTWKERMEIGNVEALGEKYIQNYQVKGEVLTGVQETADALTITPGVGIQDLIMPAPGPATELPAIRPDGTEGNIWMETAKEGLLRLSPFHDSDNHEINGPVDRHGMDFVLRGMDSLIDRTETKALNEVLQD